MASFADFMPHVLPYVPGCSSPLAELHLRAICADFCNHAPIVVVTADPIDAEANSAQYDIDLPNTVNVALILEASFAGRRLECASALPLVADVRIGTPSRYLQGAGNTITLDYAPSVDVPRALMVQVSTRPARNARTVADILLDEYGHDIGIGTAARLLAIPGQPFSNVDLATAFDRAYITARTEARIRGEAGFGRAAMTVRPRAFV